MSHDSCSSDPGACASGTVPGQGAFTRTEYVVQRKDSSDLSWEDEMRCSTWELAYRSIPYWRKDSRRALRIVERSSRVVWMDGEKP